jgi:hypothetical protein
MAQFEMDEDDQMFPTSTIARGGPVIPPSEKASDILSHAAF